MKSITILFDAAHVYELDESDDDLKKEDISFGPLGHSEGARSISLTPGSLLHGRPRPPSTSQVGYLSAIVVGHPAGRVDPYYTVFLFEIVIALYMREFANLVLVSRQELG